MCGVLAVPSSLLATYSLGRVRRRMHYRKENVRTFFSEFHYTGSSAVEFKFERESHKYLSA